MANYRLRIGVSNSYLIIPDGGNYSLSGQNATLSFSAPSIQSFTESADTGTVRFIRPNGTTYGTGSGVDWNNAISGFSGINWASIAANDTFYVAGSTTAYTQNLQPQKACKFRTARGDSTACTSAAGWNTSFASTVIHTGTIIIENVSNIEISGSATNTGTDPFKENRYAWRIDKSATTGGEGIFYNNSATAQNVKFRWIDLKGPGAINYTADGRAIDATPFFGSTAANHTFEHLKIHDWESAIYCCGSSGGHLFQYLDVCDIHPLNTGTFHPNGILTNDCPNCIVRYSKWYKGPNGHACGEGIFFEQGGGSTGWQIYGNLFYDIDYTGVKAIEITAEAGAVKIFNNTFVNVPIVGTIYTSNSYSATGGEQRNNYVFNCGIELGIPGMTSSNNITATNTAQFNNYATRDLHLVSTSNGRNAGTALTINGFINKDMDGNARGADGTWDVGAYEF